MKITLQTEPLNGCFNVILHYDDGHHENRNFNHPFPCFDESVQAFLDMAKRDCDLDFSEAVSVMYELFPEARAKIDAQLLAMMEARLL